MLGIRISRYKCGGHNYLVYSTDHRRVSFLRKRVALRKEARHSQWDLKQSLSWGEGRVILCPLRPSLNFVPGVALLDSIWDSTESSVGRK